MLRPCLLALALLLSPPLLAQGGDESTSRFRLANQHLQAGHPERAVPILEDLLAEDPASFPVYDRLREAYLEAGRPAEAVRLVERRIAALGASTPLLAELGRLQAAAGDLRAAEASWTRAVELAPDFAQTYRTLYAVKVQSRLWEAAREVLLQGRRRLQQEDLYRVELAELHARLGAPVEALREWAAFLRDDPERIAFVQGRLGRLLDQEGATASYRAALDRLIREEPLALPYRRLAAWLATEDGDYDAGLAHTQALDRLGREEGMALLAYAEAALQAGALDAALRGFDLVREAHPGGPSAATALLASAAVFEREAEQARERPVGPDGQRRPAPYYDEAVARYERFLERHPTHPGAVAARQRLARLRLTAYRDAEGAQTLLAALAEELPPGDAALDVRLALAEVALLQGDLARARAHFAAVEAEARSGPRADRARYELARLELYEGRFDLAEARAVVMKRNTATDVANDAIDLRLLLAEGRGPDPTDAALRAFARAELLLRQLRAEEALSALERWAVEHAGHPLADGVAFRRAEALRALGRGREAAAAFADVAAAFPESYLADRAAFAAADVLDRDLGDAAAALEAYTAFLASYPGSLLAPAARARARELRGERPS